MINIINTTVGNIIGSKYVFDDALCIYENFAPNIDNCAFLSLEEISRNDSLPQGIRKTILGDNDSFVCECIKNGIAPGFNLPPSLIAQKEKFSTIDSEFIKFLKLNNSLHYKTVCESFSCFKLEKKYKNIIVAPFEEYYPYLISFILSLAEQCETLTILTDNLLVPGISKKIGSIFISHGFVPKMESSENDSDILNIVYGKSNNQTYREDIRIFEASSMYEEINNIVNIIKNKSIDIKDVAIVGNSIDEYKPIFLTLFRDFNIDLDISKEYFSSSFTYKFIVCLLNCIIDEKDVNNFINLVRFGCIGISSTYKDTVDMFFERFGNNYDIALKNGEKYDKNGFNVVKLAIDEIGQCLYELRLDLEFSNNIHDILCSILKFLENIKYNDFLSDKTEFMDEVARNKTVSYWNCFSSLVHDIDKVYGKESISLVEFVSLFKGISRNTEIKIDKKNGSLLICDINNFYSYNKKYVFIVGGNQRDSFSFDSLVNSLERKRINVFLNSNLTTDESQKRSILNKIATVISVKRELTYISASKTNTAGTPLYPAFYFKNMLNAMQFCVEKPEKNSENILQLLLEIAEENYTQVENDSTYFKFLDLTETGEYNKRLLSALRFMYRNKSEFNIENSNKIFKEKDYYSVTMLESYNKCPFKHYIDYGIKPQSLNIFEESPADAGGYCHSAIKMFFNKAFVEKTDIYRLSEHDIAFFMEDIFNKIDSLHNDGTLDATNRNKFLKQQIQNKVICSVYNIIRQLEYGEFKIFANEYNLSLSNNLLQIVLPDGAIVNITGVIDRVDFLDKKFKIIDYKSSDKDFSKELFDKGIQLQLPLYASAIGGETAGFYYFHIQNPVLDLDKKEVSLFKKFKLSGPTNENSVNQIDNTLSPGCSSDVIPVQQLKSGEFSSRSQIYSNKEFEKIISEAKEIAKNTICSIRSSEAIAKPDKDENPCQYCEYNRICHYN